MTLFDEIQRMIDESMARPYFERGGMRTYSDVTETDKEVVLTVELPGVEKKEIDIDASEEAIRVSVESKKRKEVKGKNFYKAGSRYFEFKSTYSMPCEIDPRSVSASYTNGVLEVKAKKARATRRGLKVTVR